MPPPQPQCSPVSPIGITAPPTGGGPALQGQHPNAAPPAAPPGAQRPPMCPIWLHMHLVPPPVLPLGGETPTSPPRGTQTPTVPPKYSHAAPMLLCVTHRDHSAPYRRRTNLTRAAPQCCPPGHKDPLRTLTVPHRHLIVPSLPPPEHPWGGGEHRRHPPGAHRPPPCPPSALQVQPCGPNASLCHP